MQALVKTQKGDGFMQLMDMPVPKIAPDEVLIRVAFTGICGTDIHILHDQFAYWPPVIIGHEFSGTVEKVGSLVTSFKPGDRVVGEPHNKACGKCYQCRNGHIQNCSEKRSIGWGIDGAFAPYLKMPEKLLHLVPEMVSMQAAAVCEPCAIVAHQLLERATVTPGDNVVIMGVGPIALIAAQMAKIAGAGKIFLCGCTSDISYRLKIAEKLNCFDRFINVQEDNAEEIILSETGIGADLVVEASGAGSAIRTGIRVLRKRGRFCAIGMTGKPTVEIPWNEAMMKVIDIQFNMSSSYDGWNIALKLLATGKLNVADMVTEMPMEDWQKAFDDLENGRALKVLLRP